MSVINDGELGAEVRAKLNEVIDKIEGVVEIYNDLLIVDGMIRLNTVPVEARRFEGIPNEDVVEFVPEKTAGLILVATEPQAGLICENYTGQFLYAMHVGPTIKLINKNAPPFARKLVPSNTPLTGTTGQAGDMTVSLLADKVQIENRSGDELSFSVTIL